MTIEELTGLAPVIPVVVIDDLDAETGRLDVDVDLSEREPYFPPYATHGTGRELFAAFRDRVGRSDDGASVFTATREAIYA